MADCNVRNRTLFVHDNLPVLRGINTASIDLIATDPPFNSKREFHAPVSSKAKGAGFDDRWQWDDVAHEWYDLLATRNAGIKEIIEAAAVIEGGSVNGGINTGRVKSSMAAYLCWMAPRLVEMRRILKPSGSLYLHCDDAADSYLRLLLDAVFGRAAFRNAVTWKRTTGRSGGNRYRRVCDRVLFYGDADQLTWNPTYEPLDPGYVEKFYRQEDEHGRWRADQLSASGLRRGDSGQPWHGINPSEKGNHWRGPAAFPTHIEQPDDWNTLTTREKLDRLDQLGLIIHPKKPGGMPQFKRYLSTSKGTQLNDLWTSPLPVQTHSRERTGYPTQKPVSLYERIIRASSNPGEVVLDPFCGCSTTLLAAERLGRQWIGCDKGDRTADVIRTQINNMIGPESLPLFAETFTVRKTPPGRTDIKSMSKAELRLNLWNRQAHRCANPECTSGELRREDMEHDHRIPKSRGGDETPDNALGLCGNCNRRKGKQAWGQFLAGEFAEAGRRAAKSGPRKGG